MQSTTVRVDQAEHLRTELEKAYRAYGRMPMKPWLRPEDKAEIREDLDRATKSAQAAIAIINQQPGASAELQQLRGKLVVLSTMAETDLKQAAR